MRMRTPLWVVVIVCVAIKVGEGSVGMCGVEGGGRSYHAGAVSVRDSFLDATVGADHNVGLLP